MKRLLSLLPLALLLGAAEGPKVEMIAPGVISTQLNEFSGRLSPDGNELYFTASVPRSYRYASYVSRKVRGRWTTPELLPFVAPGRDTDAVLSADGRSIILLSDRPLTPGGVNGYDLWRVDRDASGKWGPARNLGAPINFRDPAKHREINETSGFIAMDGTIYLALDRPGEGLGAPDIYTSRLVNGVYEKPVHQGSKVNSPGFEAEPNVSPDGRYLLFSSYDRPGGKGDWDVWISRRQPDGQWGEPENLGPAVNGPERDYSAYFTADGNHIIFTSERSFATGRTGPMTYKELRKGISGILNGHGNLYMADLRTLGLKNFGQ